MRAKLRRLARDLRFEDAARVRDRLAALEQVVARIAELDRLRATRVCLLAPACEPGFRRAFFVTGGRVAAVRTLPDGRAGRLEVEAGIAEASLAAPSFAPEDADELLRGRRIPPPPGPGAARRLARLRRDPRCVVQPTARDLTMVRVPEERNFADRLADAVERKRSQLVVGLDPRLDLLPMELRGEGVLGRAAAASAVARFCKGIVDAVGPYVVAIKPQSAFFEALGSDGIKALEEVCDYARSSGLLVILDAKRGDIGSTARAYASAFLEPRERLGAPVADAMTVSAYLGHDSVEPFLAACRRHGSGIFLLVRTSNAGAADIQD